MPVIFSGFAPHTSFHRVCLSLKALIQPAPGTHEETEVATELAQIYGVPFVALVDSGRSALTLALQALQLSPGDEVLVSGYTCMVVANAIRAAGLTPVYVDIDASLTMNPTLVEGRITPQTKVLLTQYTFGEPGHLDHLLALAKKHHLVVVEDVAHSLFGQYQGALLGTFGSVAFTSFGREKYISSERGGAVFSPTSDIAGRLKELCASLPAFPMGKTRNHLLVEPLFWIAKKMYGIEIGKLILAIAKRLALIPPIISPQEKIGVSEPCYAFPQKLLPLLNEGLEHIEEIHRHRTMIANVYDAELLPTIRRQKRADTTIPLEYAIWVPEPDILVTTLRDRDRIVLSRGWGGSPIVPKDIKRSEALYSDGSCPEAEAWAQGMVGLPTHEHISVDDAKRLCRLINAYVSR